MGWLDPLLSAHNNTNLIVYMSMYSIVTFLLYVDLSCFLCLFPRAKWVIVGGAKYKCHAILHIGYDDDIPQLWKIYKICIVDRNIHLLFCQYKPFHLKAISSAIQSVLQPRKTWQFIITNISAVTYQSTYVNHTADKVGQNLSVPDMTMVPTTKAMFNQCCQMIQRQH